MTALNMKSYTATDVKRIGIEQVMKETLEYLGNNPLHISFDIDGLDSFEAPSTGTPVVDGLSLEEG